MDELTEMLEAMAPTNRCIWCQANVKNEANVCSDCLPGHIALWEEHTDIMDKLVKQSAKEEKRYTQAKRKFHKQQLKKRAMHGESGAESLSDDE